MRTTLTIDDDLLEAARALASQRRIPLGKAVSELMRKGLNPVSRRPRTQAGRFPTFEVPPGARPVTLETVKRAEDDS